MTPPIPARKPRDVSLHGEEAYGTGEGAILVLPDAGRPLGAAVARDGIAPLDDAELDDAELNHAGALA